MEELKGALVVAVAAVTVYVGVETAHKVAADVVKTHIPLGHCAEAVGYNYDHRCHNKELYQYRYVR